MGLDAVEIVLRTEELFTIAVEDEEAAAIVTVGDFYRLICDKLDIPPLSSPATSAELPVITQRGRKLWLLQTYTQLPAPPSSLPWSSQSVWDALVAIFVEQQGLKPHRVLYHARIAQDLGID